LRRCRGQDHLRVGHGIGPQEQVGVLLSLVNGLPQPVVQGRLIREQDLLAGVLARIAG